MKTTFLSAAESELYEAVEWYNRQSEGLGFEFAAEVRRTLQRIGRYPDAWTFLSDSVRRCRTNRFPYGILYQIRPDEILVVAVMHMSRSPDSWRTRLK